MTSIDYTPRTRLIVRNGGLSQLGAVARELGFARTLLVADLGIVRLGLVDRACEVLAASGIDVVTFHDFDANPDTAMVERGRLVASGAAIDSMIALGGGSSLDCAKGINFVHTNGGNVREYRGHGKATRALLPMIAVPTTAGTGSDAQSYALISDADTHEKMACGDPGAAFKVALLDPELTVSQPRALTATVGYDAVSHVVESFVTTRRTPISDLFAREAWRLLSGAFERVLERPGDLDARGAMLLGSHFAGAAIEQSMLGATHACANPLTARYGTTHGVAIALMLPHVVAWNADVVGDRYAELLAIAGWTGGGEPALRLSERLRRLSDGAGLPSRLRDIDVPAGDIPELAAAAALQWTGTFNPRPFNADAAAELYTRAY
ncbi:MAG: iron-containing alcohol dehydrogenase [Vicinamibacterales bacterium]